jgi:uncharacterized protein YceK
MIGLVASLTMASGCGTVVGMTNSEWSKKTLRQVEVDPSTKVYIGVRASFGTFLHSSKRWPTDAIADAILLADTLVSAVADTLLLPVTLSWKESAADERAVHSQQSREP